MARNVNEEILFQFVIDTLQIDPPNEGIQTLTLANLGIDSLEIVSLSMAIEDEFQLKIDLDKIQTTTTLKDFFNQLQPIE